MKKSTMLMTGLLFALVTLWGQQVRAQTLAERFSGRILLQVERQGQAWYVNPLTKKRALLGRPYDAFKVMKMLGRGMSNENINRIPEAGGALQDTAFARKFAGSILLQVQSQGQAWYVNPVDLRRYYLGRPNDALVLMHRLGVGITDANLAMIVVDSRFGQGIAKPATPVSPVAVKISNYSFMPGTLVIKAGQTVRWTNTDAVLHQIKSDSFNSLPLSTGGTYSHTFNTVGTYNYSCAIHLTMQGTIIVQ